MNNSTCNTVLHMLCKWLKLLLAATLCIVFLYLNSVFSLSGSSVCTTPKAKTLVSNPFAHWTLTLFELFMLPFLHLELYLYSKKTPLPTKYKLLSNVSDVAAGWNMFATWQSSRSWVFWCPVKNAWRQLIAFLLFLFLFFFFPSIMKPVLYERSMHRIQLDVVFISLQVRD